MAWKVLVINPADIPQKDKQQYQKTDKTDSINLSKQLQKQQLKAIHIPTEQQEQLRSLLRQVHVSGRHFLCAVRVFSDYFNDIF